MRHRHKEDALQVGLLSSGRCVEEGKKLLHPSDRERVVHPLAHPNQVKAAFFFLMSNISPYERSDARGVHVRNVGEIQKQGAGLVGPNLGLEVEQVAKNERPVKSQ